MPHIQGSTAFSAKAQATAASMALPPLESASAPAAAAIQFCEATTPPSEATARFLTCHCSTLELMPRLMLPVPLMMVPRPLVFRKKSGADSTKRGHGAQGFSKITEIPKIGCGGSGPAPIMLRAQGEPR